MSSADSTTVSSLHITCLGSGSSGNATVLHAPDGLILVDAGFSAKETLRRVEDAGLDPRLIRAILVTHEHGDHVRGVRVLAKRLGVPVWATDGTHHAANLYANCDDCRTMVHGEPTRIAGADLIAFSTSHDTVDPIGVRAETGSSTAAIMTDTGVFTPQAREALQECDTIAMECNHDVTMLSQGPYPWFLKQRILSTRGHLSNDDAASALADVACDRLRIVYALHLSEANNTHPLASNALGTALERLDHPAHVVTVGPNGPRD